MQTILLVPAGYKLPAKAEEPVRVRMELARSREQITLFKQVAIALEQLGFNVDLGFDSQNFTVIKGTIPAGNVTKLLRDLRQQPSGWLLPNVAQELYARLPDGTLTPNLVRPFADGVPVRVVEVLGSAAAAPAIVTLPPIPAGQTFLVKLTADLRRKLAEPGVRDKPLRLEVVLVTAPQEFDIGWRGSLSRAGAVVEGRVGSVVTVMVAKGSGAGNIAAARRRRLGSLAANVEHAASSETQWGEVQANGFASDVDRSDGAKSRIGHFEADAIGSLSCSRCDRQGDSHRDSRQRFCRLGAALGRRQRRQRLIH